MTHKKLINPTVSLYPASFPKTNMFSREWSVEQLVRKYYFIYKNCNIIGGPFDVYLSLDQGWVTLSADPRHLGALRRTVSLVSEGGGGEWKNGWNAFVRLSLGLESRSWKALISSTAPYAFNSFFYSKTKLKLKHIWEQGCLVFWGPYVACVFCEFWWLWPSGSTFLNNLIKVFRITKIRLQAGEFDQGWSWVPEPGVDQTNIQTKSSANIGTFEISFFQWEHHRGGPLCANPDQNCQMQNSSELSDSCSFIFNNASTPEDQSQWPTHLRHFTGCWYTSRMSNYGKHLVVIGKPLEQPL